jgi:hypothetical protein
LIKLYKKALKNLLIKVEEKTVRFAGLLPLTIEIERKWDAPIEGQKKGKFDK